MKTPFASKMALVATTALILTNCSGPAYPPCDDPTVLGLVDELIRDHIWDRHIKYYTSAIGSVTYDYLVQESDQNIAGLEQRISDIARWEQDLAQAIAANPEDWTNEVLQDDIDGERESIADTKLRAEKIRALPDVVAAAKFTHSFIRTQDFNEQIRKSSCVSQVNIQDQNRTGEPTSDDVQFIYSAQYTDDGSEIYVEGGFM